MTEELKNVSAQMSWVDRVTKRFKETGRIIPERQEKLYQKVRDEFAGGRVCLDVGCSLGVGSNILSHTARYVWGVDINEEAVNYAKKVFRRPNLDFEVIDIENPPTRELSKFELVTMIETLEHLEHPDQALNNLKRFFTQDTIGFITVPNIANGQAKENEQKHGLHLHHWKAGQFYEMMTNHFQAVTLYSVDKLDVWDHSETVDGDSTDYLIVAKCEGIK